jgi:hypothetical protein
MAKVFVNWDPLYEEVICVHTTAEGECEKCRKISKEREEDHSCYTIAGDWFDVVEDK